MLSQLEHAFNTAPSFSLQKLWLYVHPTVHTLSLIYQLILELATADDPGADLSSSSSSSEEDAEEAAKNEALGLGKASLKAVLSEIKQGDIHGSGGSGIPVKGGEVLTIIYERMQNMSGDPTASVIYGTLLKKAGRPYVQMLKDWVASGRLVDPHEELLVKESKFIDRGTLEMDYTDEYWERRYTVRHFFPMLACIDWRSCETARHQVLRNVIKPVYRRRARLGGVCLEALACHRFWRAGSTRSYWLGNISTSFANVALRCLETRRTPMTTNSLWTMRGTPGSRLITYISDVWEDSISSLRTLTRMQIAPSYSCFSKISN